MSTLWFPPRLVKANDDIEDPTERMDEAVERYLEEGIAVIDLETESIQDCMKIIHFARQFKDL